jgi:hypothetical protein
VFTDAEPLRSLILLAGRGFVARRSFAYTLLARQIPDFGVLAAWIAFVAHRKEYMFKKTKLVFAWTQYRSELQDRWLVGFGLLHVVKSICLQKQSYARLNTTKARLACSPLLMTRSGEIEGGDWLEAGLLHVAKSICSENRASAR